MKSEQGRVKQLLKLEYVYTNFLATCPADMQRQGGHLHAFPRSESYSMGVFAHSGNSIRVYVCERLRPRAYMYVRV